MAIILGRKPGGSGGGGGAPSGPAGGVLSGTYPDPGFAVDPILETIGDAKGDLIGFSAADTPARLAAGSNGQVLTAQSGQATGLQWASAYGVLDYSQITGNVTISATSEASPTTIVTAGAVSFDGSTRCKITFFAGYVAVNTAGGGNQVLFNLWDGSTEVGRMAQMSVEIASTFRWPVEISRVITPSNGSHTYSIRAWRTNANGEVGAGSGAAGQNPPAYILIERIP